MDTGPCVHMSVRFPNINFSPKAVFFLSLPSRSRSNPSTYFPIPSVGPAHCSRASCHLLPSDGYSTLHLQHLPLSPHNHSPISHQTNVETQMCLYRLKTLPQQTSARTTPRHQDGYQTKQNRRTKINKQTKKHPYQVWTKIWRDWNPCATHLKKTNTVPFISVQLTVQLTVETDSKS